jgi:hypothetical protein
MTKTLTTVQLVEAQLKLAMIVDLRDTILARMEVNETMEDGIERLAHVMITRAMTILANEWIEALEELVDLHTDHAAQPVERMAQIIKLADYLTDSGQHRRGPRKPQ